MTSRRRKKHKPEEIVAKPETRTPRECLALMIDRGITSSDYIDTLGERFAMRGAPKHIRSDNGPEFIASSLRARLGRVGVSTLYIEPGSPWENGYAESFNSRIGAS